MREIHDSSCGCRVVPASGGFEPYLDTSKCKFPPPESSPEQFQCGVCWGVWDYVDVFKAHQERCRPPAPAGSPRGQG